MLRSDLGPPEQEGRGCIRMSLEEGHKGDQRSRACLLQRQAEEAGVVQPGEEGSEEGDSGLPVPKGGPTGKLGKDSLSGSVVAGQGGVALN